MVGRSQLGSQGVAQILAIREGARRRQGDVEERWRGKWKNSEGCRSLYLEESGGWGDAGRLTRRDHAKPDGAALGLEAGKGGHFTRTQIILKFSSYRS